MEEQDKQKLVARLRRLAGQVRALEGLVNDRDPEKFVTQLSAVNAAGKSTLRFYIEKRLLANKEIDPSERKLLLRLIEQT